MSRRSQKFAASDVPADVRAPDQLPSHNELTPGSPARSTPDAVSTAQKRQAIAAVSASGKAAPRPGSKLGIVLGLLEAPDGASLARLVEVTGWLPHTTRAALTGLRKRGYAVSSEKAKGDDYRPLSIYRVAAAKVAS